MLQSYPMLLVSVLLTIFSSPVQSSPAIVDGRFEGNKLEQRIRRHCVSIIQFWILQ